VSREAAATLKPMSRMDALGWMMNDGRRIVEVKEERLSLTRLDRLVLWQEPSIALGRDQEQGSLPRTQGSWHNQLCTRLEKPGTKMQFNI
jgi:hypothetical protein